MSVRLDLTSEELKQAGFRPLHGGDDYVMQFTAQRDGAVFDLTSAVVWMTIKDDPIATDAQARLQLSSPSSGITITDAVNGVFQVTFARADTASLEADYWYDIQIKTGADEVITWAYGKIEFLPNLTRTVS